MKREDEAPRLEGKEGVRLDFEEACVRKRKNPFFLPALILLIMAVGVLLARMIYLNSQNTGAPPANNEYVEVWQGAFDSEEIFLQCKKSSVTVIADGRVCSGFVLSSDGWIVTVNDTVNYQVKGRVRVRLYDGSLHDVVAFRESRRAGVVLMKIDAEGLCKAKIYSGKKPTAGQNIYTFCALSADEDASLFSGEISHVGRRVELDTENGRKKILSLMQISVLLTQEGVGAPFFNDAGELVGMGAASVDGGDRYIISYAYFLGDIANLLEKMKSGKCFSDELFPFVLE